MKNLILTCATVIAASAMSLSAADGTFCSLRKVTDVTQLQYGKQYVIKGYSTVAETSARCLTLSADGSTISFTAPARTLVENTPVLASDFASAIWTMNLAATTSCSCATANHTSTGIFATFTNGGKFWQVNNSGIVTTSPTVTAETDLCDVELIQKTYNGELVFLFHYAPQNSSNFYRTFCINGNGSMGYYGGHATNFRDDAPGTDTGGYTLYFSLYEVVPIENPHTMNSAPMLTQVSNVVPGCSYIITAVNSNWTEPSFLANVSEVQGETGDFGVWRKLSELDNDGVPYANVIWEAEAASAYTAPTGASQAVRLKTASGRYYSAGHGNITKANNFLTNPELGTAVNYASATYTKAEATDKTVFSFLPVTRTELAGYGTVFNIKANTEKTSANGFTTCLGVRRQHTGDDKDELCAGQNGNYYNAATSYFVIYRVEWNSDKYPEVFEALEAIASNSNLNEYTLGEAALEKVEELRAFTFVNPTDFQAKHQEVLNLRTLNLPQPGRYIRIRTHATCDTVNHYTTPWYIDITNTVGDHSMLTADRMNPGTILYLEDAGSGALNMLSYKSGYYSIGGATSDHLRSYTSGTTNTPYSVRFCASSVADSGEAYNLIYLKNGATSVRSLHIAGTSPCTNSCSAAENACHNLYLEYVDELPVTIDSDGYGTCYLPVAVTVPDGYTVYTSAVDDRMLVLTEQTDGYIPAHTAAFIKGEAGTIYVTVDYDAAAAEEDTTSPVRGHHAITTRTASSGNALFVKSASAPAANAPARIVATGTEMPMARFTTLDSNIMPVHTMVVEASTSSANDDGEIFIPVQHESWYDLASGVNATGISSVMVNNLDGSVDVYDLNGRRVSRQASPGIYIVNGRKQILR